MLYLKLSGCVRSAPSPTVHPGAPRHGAESSRRRWSAIYPSAVNLALWIVAGLLAAVLLISTSKAFVPREKIAAVGGSAAEWVEDFSPGALRAIATLELLAAAGLILPAALDIAPGAGAAGRHRYGVAVYRRGNHAPPPWREENDRARPGLSRHGRIRGVGPLRPRVLHRLTQRGVWPPPLTASMLCDIAYSASPAARSPSSRSRKTSCREIRPS
jgi:hypothetical protein